MKKVAGFLKEASGQGDSADDMLDAMNNVIDDGEILKNKVMNVLINGGLNAGKTLE